MKIRYVLLSDYNFEVNKDLKDENPKSKFNMNFEYGISYPEQIEQTINVFLRFDLDFNKGDDKIFIASGVYQMIVEDAEEEFLSSKEFHIDALHETYEKFVTLYNISASQTPHKKAILSDDVLNDLISSIREETVKD
ncbi:hypothetical protein ACV3PA_12250 [Exiguobacterium acetylicum]